MKAFMFASACLAGLALAGCATNPDGSVTASPAVVSTEQQAFNFVCPSIKSGALDPVAASFNANVQSGYAKAKQICNVGVIQTPGDFAADFLIIEPVIAQYFGNVKIKL